MNCPVCNSQTCILSVAKGKLADERRRRCKTCGHEFTTYENYRNRATVFVRKKDGTTELFSSEKLKQSLKPACPRKLFPNDWERYNFIACVISQIQKTIYNSGLMIFPTTAIEAKVKELLAEENMVCYFLFVLASAQDLGDLAIEEIMLRFS